MVLTHHGEGDRINGTNQASFQNVTLCFIYPEVKSVIKYCLKCFDSWFLLYLEDICREFAFLENHTGKLKTFSKQYSYLIPLLLIGSSTFSGQYSYSMQYSYSIDKSNSLFNFRYRLSLHNLAPCNYFVFVHICLATSTSCMIICEKLICF